MTRFELLKSLTVEQLAEELVDGNFISDLNGDAFCKPREECGYGVIAHIR